MSYIYKSGKEYGLTNITINQNTPTRELTQAQYDALPISEKRNGTIYFIIDATSDKIVVTDPAPIGAILAYAGDTAPDGWLLCAGQAISRTTYSELFAVIGTTYGIGDGSTTFNVPDFRGNVAIGASTTYNLGDSGGEAIHTLNQNEIPNYDIGFMATVVPGSHSQWSNGGIIGAGGATGASQGKSGTIYMAGTANTQPQYGWTVKTNGGSQAHNNMQPYVVTNYIIKAKETSAVIGTRSGGGGSVDSTPIPTATLVAEFDDNAHMNSEDMSAADVSSFVGDLNPTDRGVLADYVIDQGTSGIWIYRKWNSGIAECWGTRSYTPTNWQAWGQVYEGIASGYQENYPTNFFIERPFTTATIKGNGAGYWLETYVVGDETKTDGYVAVRPTTAATGTIVYINIHAIGRWK